MDNNLLSIVALYWSWFPLFSKWPHREDTMERTAPEQGSVSTVIMQLCGSSVAGGLNERLWRAAALVREMTKRGHRGAFMDIMALSDDHRRRSGTCGGSLLSSWNLFFSFFFSTAWQTPSLAKEHAHFSVLLSSKRARTFFCLTFVFPLLSYFSISIFKLFFFHLSFLSVLVVPAGSPSRGGDVTVYVKDLNQPSLPTLFFSLFLCLFLSLLPFQLYFIT